MKPPAGSAQPFGAGWLHPAGAVTDDQDCPCGSEQPYSACHGATIPAGDHPAAS